VLGLVGDLNRAGTARGDKSNLEQMVFGALIIIFLIVEPHGLAPPVANHQGKTENLAVPALAMQNGKRAQAHRSKNEPQPKETEMTIRHTLAATLAAAALTRRPSPAQAQEQFIPCCPTASATTAAGGSGFYGGMIDYFNLVNSKGGVNGVKITFEECENRLCAGARGRMLRGLKKKNGGATAVEPLGTGACLRPARTASRSTRFP